jgi:hypothetical protein
MVLIIDQSDFPGACEVKGRKQPTKPTADD